jgi:glucose-1-phosphate thymidylyltransferase
VVVADVDLSEKAVILAAGRGTRMRATASGRGLTGAQEAMARRGIKGMIPVGRPFLDYVLSGLADAGVQRVCLVTGPGQPEMREYYEGAGRPSRVRLEFAVQARPFGTADAVLAAEPFAAAAPVLVVNADNLYPRSALRALRSLPRAGLVGFRRSGLVRAGNIPAERIAAFALVEAGTEGRLTRIVEKPDPKAAASFEADPLVSMNAWLLPPSIYTACRAITRSPRGELELQDAVRYASERLGERFQVVESTEGVLDLSRPEDIAEVTARLQQIEARP